MTCDEARLLIGADPSALTPTLEEHVAGCAACAQLRREMQTLNGDIFRALQEPPDMRAAARARPGAAWRQWALAASAVLATFALFAVWLLRPSDTLAHDIVRHVQGEPDSWLATQHATAPELEHALSRAGVTLNIVSPHVVYAQSCWFRGHYVPHLVVQSDLGPVTVMILRHVSLPRPQAFDEDGLRGVIVPADHGSIAVLSRGAGDPRPVAGMVQADVRWLAEPAQPPPPKR
ncbi:MAG: hypothetical protein PVS2B3_05790 [Steroidobacteraceae bacterium]